MECLFCKIANKLIPSHVIYEDVSAVSFLDINPISMGHTVVVPKEHAQNLLEIPDSSLGDFFGAVKNSTAMLQKALNPAGFTIGINHGRISGQSVDHLHVHIIPRFEGDGGGSLHSVVHNPPNEPLEAIKNRILESNKSK
ncbi:MAG: HIT family protein [Candidatus Colwellbacteria bacterium]|nr:HIT family protein [Candidatus Colwellbacteria bacterium]